MRSPRLAALELRRFGRGKLPRAALVALLLLPLLYGALYLWSFWDPYGRLDRVHPELDEFGRRHRHDAERNGGFQHGPVNGGKAWRDRRARLAGKSRSSDQA